METLRSRLSNRAWRCWRRYRKRPRVFRQELCATDRLTDNGALSPAIAGELAGLTLPSLLETLKPSFDNREPGADDAAFQSALAIARAFVEAGIEKKAAKLRAETLVLKAIERTGESRILELPIGMPFRPAIVKAGAVSSALRRSSS